MIRRILLPILLVLATSVAVAQPAADITGFYAGTLGKKLAVTLSLGQSGTAIAGYYHYDKNRVDIRLAGEMADDGTVTLSEYGYFKVTGTWSGTLADGALVGTWTSGDGKRHLNFSLGRVALKGTPGDPIGDKAAFGAVDAKLPFEPTAVPGDLAATLFAEMVDGEQIDTDPEGSQQEVLALAKSDPAQLFSGVLIDFNGDGTPELVVFPSEEKGACTYHNCPLWIFRKADGGYTRILEGYAGIFGFMPLNQSTSGFNDIALIGHASAAEHSYTIYTFDGTEYRETRCIMETALDEDHVTYKDSCD